MSGGKGEIPVLLENIPWPVTKKQMKLAHWRSLYHKQTSFCDVSDNLSDIQQSKIIKDLSCMS
jgi:hypothetical protein